MSYSSATAGTAGRGTTAASQALSLSSVTAGAMVCASACLWRAGGTPAFPASITDNHGHTLTLRRSDLTGSLVVGQYEGVCSTGGTVSFTVTSSGGTGAAQWDAVPFWYTGNPTSGEFDVSIGSNGSSTTANTTSTATTNANSELGIGSFTTLAGNNAVWTGTDTPNGVRVVYSQPDNQSLQAHRVLDELQGQGTGPINLHSVSTDNMTTVTTPTGAWAASLSVFIVDTGGTFDPATVPQTLSHALPLIPTPIGY